jgi:hypothetical protein
VLSCSYHISPPPLLYYSFQNKGYVKQLSPTALNLGLRATQADYPSLCLHSMIGDQVFDVIILEFCPFRGKEHQDFERLAKRLRARFPSAVMIYLLMPMPLNDVLYQGNNMQQYLQSIQLPSKADAMFEPIIKNLSNVMVWNPRNDVDAYNRTITSVGGVTVVFPNLYDNITDFILLNAKYFGDGANPWDFVHPNALGHQLAADAIRQKVLEILNDRPLMTPTVVGKALSAQESCISWFQDPKQAKVLVQVTNMYMTNYPTGYLGRWEKGRKWSLEVDPTGGSLSIQCSTFLPSCHIYLSYMATMSGFYPKVVVSVNDEHHTKQTTLIDPLLEAFHLRQIAYVGAVHDTPIANVTVIPVPEDANRTKRRFRIAGIILTASFIEDDR